MLAGWGKSGRGALPIGADQSTGSDAFGEIIVPIFALVFNIKKYVLRIKSGAYGVVGGPLRPAAAEKYGYVTVKSGQCRAPI